MPSWVDSASDVMRLLIIFQSCFVCGMVSFIVWFYSGSQAVSGKLRHIQAISISYTLMTFAILLPMGIHKYALLSVAFALGDYALFKVISFLKVDKYGRMVNKVTQLRD